MCFKKKSNVKETESPLSSDSIGKMSENSQQFATNRPSQEELSRSNPSSPILYHPKPINRSKRYHVQDSLFPTESLSAFEFAEAVGLVVQAFNDNEDEEINQFNTILSSISGTTQGHLTPALDDSISGKSSSFPRLDMSIFTAPEGHNSTTQSDRNMLCYPPSPISSPHTIGHARSAEIIQFKPTSTSLPRETRYSSRRASESLIDLHPSLKHFRSQSASPHLTCIDNDDDDTKIHKKGRFIIKVERSSHFYAKSPKTRKSSRFSLSSDNTSSPTLSTSCPKDSIIQEEVCDASGTLKHATASSPTAEERRDSGYN